VADIRVLPIKSLALRGFQPPLHENHTVFYTTKMFDLEELILVDTTVGPKSLSRLPPAVKEYVAKFEMDLKHVSANFVRSRKYDCPNRLRGRIWQDVLSPW